MKDTLFIKRCLRALGVSMLILPGIAFAQTNTGDCSTSTSLWDAFGGGDLLSVFPHYCNAELTTVFFIRLLTGFVGIVATLSIMWYGYRWMTAGSNATQLTSARKGVIWAAMGLIIVLLANVIIYFVTNFVIGGVGGGNNTNVNNNNVTNQVPVGALVSEPDVAAREIIASIDFDKSGVKEVTENGVKKYIARLYIPISAEKQSLVSLCPADQKKYIAQLLVGEEVVESKTLVQTGDVAYKATIDFEAEVEEQRTDSVDVKICGKSIGDFPTDFSFYPNTVTR